MWIYFWAEVRKGKEDLAAREIQGLRLAKEDLEQVYDQKYYTAFFQYKPKRVIGVGVGCVGKEFSIDSKNVIDEKDWVKNLGKQKKKRIKKNLFL